MIRLEDVTLSPGGHDLLVGASWHLRAGDRVGLVGRNGAGKSTLLRAIVGEQPLERGRIHLRQGTRIGWLPQQAVSGSQATVWDEVASRMDRLNELEAALERAEQAVAEGVDGAIERLEAATERFRHAGGFAKEARIGEVLSGLGFGPDSWHRTCDTFSGGWQMRIALARMLLSAPDVALLDEPTNHLDIATRTWLARHLASAPYPVVLVSHDRHLLDGVCNRIVEVSRHALHHYTGGFTAYLRERELRATQHEAAFEAQQAEIAKLERFVERFKAKATKASQARSRQKQLDKLDRIDAPDAEPLPRFRLPPSPAGDAIPLALKQASLGFVADDGQRTEVLSEVDLELQRGMKVAILGPNGAGKSTLLRTLAGRLRPLSGQRVPGRRVRIGHFAQDLAQELPPDQRAVDWVAAQAPAAEEARLRGVLGALGLTGDAALRDIGQLSGGEKARVALSALALTPVDLLLLDEPTNHLDVVTVEVLVRALRDYDGTLVLVSHDRYLVEQLATHVAFVHEGRVTWSEGLRPDHLEPVSGTATTTPGEAPVETEDGPEADGALSYEERKALQREIERARKQIGRHEARLEELDATIARIDARLFDVGGDFEEASRLGRERDEAEAEQVEVMEAWEALEEQAAELEERLS